MALYDCDRLDSAATRDVLSRAYLVIAEKEQRKRNNSAEGFKYSALCKYWRRKCNDDSKVAVNDYVEYDAGYRCPDWQRVFVSSFYLTEESIQKCLTAWR